MWWCNKMYNYNAFVNGCLAQCQPPMYSIDCDGNVLHYVYCFWLTVESSVWAHIGYTFIMNMLQPLKAKFQNQIKTVVLSEKDSYFINRVSVPNTIQQKSCVQHCYNCASAMHIQYAQLGKTSYLTIYLLNECTSRRYFVPKHILQFFAYV